MIKIAFRYGDNTPDSIIVCWWTKSPFDHFETYVEGRGWFSARTDKGVSYIDELPGPPERWRIIELACQTTHEAVAWADSMIGAKYDYISLADFVIHDGLIAAGREICSRAGRDYLAHCKWASLPVMPANPSPGDMAREFLPPDCCSPLRLPVGVDPEELLGFARRCAAIGCEHVASGNKTVAGPFGIDMTHINAAADSVKALSEQLLTGLAKPLAWLQTVDYQKIENEITKG